MFWKGRGRKPGKWDIDPETPTRALLGKERGPIGQLSPQVWRDWPETRAVIAAFQAEGVEVRFVGGCVRDALAHRPVRDVDLATPAPPDRVVALLEQAGLKAVPTGLAHGTITAVVGSRAFEITTLRQDVETDGRHARVRWSSDWMADAARRDFTLNALSARPEDGAVFDYFEGLEDLAHKRVRFIGRPLDRIDEDVLRILRFFRFQATYGGAGVNADALAACRLRAPRLAELSGERVRDELLKIIAAERATETLLLMRGERILNVILPEATHFGRLRQMVFFETRGLRLPGLAVDPLRRLAALIEADQSAVPALADRLRLSGEQRKRLAALAAPAEEETTPTPALSPHQRRAVLHRLGPGLFLDRALLAWAEERAQEGHTDAQGSAAWITLLEEAAHGPLPSFPLRGHYLLALGLDPGPAVGRLLRVLEDWWLHHGCHPTHTDVLEEARRRLGLGLGD